MQTIKNGQTALFIAALAMSILLPANAQQLSVAEQAAMLKATIAASQAMLRQYEWVETTVINLKGEEKSRKQERCYYGADGGVQKIGLSSSPEPKKKRGLRGRIAERKQEELTDYMKSAVALVKTYVPPNPALIQAAKDAGNVSLAVLDPGKRVRLDFTNYKKPGDKLSVQVDLVRNRPLQLSVSSYVDDPSEPVTLIVKMGLLTGGTSYPAQVTLDAPAKKLSVNVTNSGYRKLN